MDRIPSKEPVALSYFDLSCEAPDLTEPWELCLRIVSSFQITEGHRVLYVESMFPVVEFAIESQLWAKSLDDGKRDFVFTSMEAEEEGLVWIKSLGSSWQVGSVFGDRPSSPLRLQEVLAALNDFYTHLQSDVAKRFQKDIASLLAWKRGE